MVWDLLNLAVHLAYATLAGLEATLPASPLFLSAGDLAAVAGVATYAAFFMPVSAMLATFVLFVAGVLVWVGILLLKQLIEAVTP